MSGERKISRIWKSRSTIEGAGVHLKRVFGFHQVPQLDPFLLLDDFHSDNPGDYNKGFPWHPHRGIETISYVLQGQVEHGDSMDNKGVIASGDVQWMTAGSGIVHQEMPAGDENSRLWGLQLWANLPASHKMIDPRYQEIKSDEIPQVTLPKEVKVSIICGKVNGEEGPVKDIVTGPQYLDVTVPANTTFEYGVAGGHTVFAYVLEGEGYFDRARDTFAFEVEWDNYCELDRTCRVNQESLVLYEREGDKLLIATEETPMRFLLVSGKPLGEPVAWHGPIVMNTGEELRTAFEEYHNGTFIKKGTAMV